MALSASLASCALFKSSCSQSTNINSINADSLSVIYSDSVDSIILNPTKVRLYEMADFVISEDTIEERDSLFTFLIKKDIGFLNDDCREILLFIISDRKWYIKNYAPVKQPFHPNIALEFLCRKKRAFMFISFGTEEVAIASNDGIFSYYQMRNMRLMARWAFRAFPNSEYYKELVK